MKKRHLIFILAAFSATPAFALENIVRPFTTVRSKAMGGVMYSTGIYEDNFFGNPARTSENPTWRIDLLNLTSEVNSGAISNLGDLTKSGDRVANVSNTAGKNNHARVQTAMPALYIPRLFGGRNYIALGLFTNSQIDLDLRRNLSVEPYTTIDAGPAFTFARKFLKDEKLTIGITMHYMYRASIRDTFSTIDYISGKKPNTKDVGQERTTLDFDLGATHDIRWRPWGLELQGAATINNVLGGNVSGAKLDLINGDRLAPRLNRSFNLGVSGSKPLWKFEKTTFAFEIQDIGNNQDGSIFRTLHLGSEAWISNLIAFRAGINQGYFCAGIGFDLPVLKLDLATYGEEMSLNAGGLEDRRYAVKIGLAI